MLRIESLDWFILIIKNWPNDGCVGCDGPLKPKIMVEFLKKDSTTIEKHTRLIEEQNFFEKYSNFDFNWF